MLSSYNEDEVRAYADKHREKVDYYFFMQYHLDRQLREARDYANRYGVVVLKGDIPIGVSRFSADAWTNPRLFNMDCQGRRSTLTISQYSGKTGDYPRTTGMSWQKMVSNGGRNVSARCRNIAMPTA